MDAASWPAQSIHVWDLVAAVTASDPTVCPERCSRYTSGRARARSRPDRHHESACKYGRLLESRPATGQGPRSGNSGSLITGASTITGKSVMEIGTVIELKSVQKVVDQKTVIDIETLIVPDGSIAALVGPVGSGTDTLFDLLLGRSRPSVGADTPGRHRSVCAAQPVHPPGRRPLCRGRSLPAAIGPGQSHLLLPLAPPAQGTRPEVLTQVGLVDQADTVVEKLSLEPGAPSGIRPRHSAQPGCPAAVRSLRPLR